MQLSDSVDILAYVGPSYLNKLEILGIKTIKDLLYYIPHRYIDFSKNIPIAKTNIDDLVTIKGEVTFLKNQYTKSGKKIQIGKIEDASSSITVVWFNQPYLVRTIYPGSKLSLAGKIEWFGHQKALISPEYERIESSTHTGRIVPVYHETAGLSSKWLRARIKSAIEKYLTLIKDPLPRAIRDKYSLLSLKEAIKNIHYPKIFEDVEDGRTRLAFDELLGYQIDNLKRKRDWEKNITLNKINIVKSEIDTFIKSLPFDLTPSQNTTYKEIINDMQKGVPMNRLLEGDVGSGKTVVAAIAVFTAFSNGYQSVIMAPTQILAEQHFQTISNLFSKYKARVSLITSDKKISDIGRYDIIIGTHSLLEDKVNLGNPAVVVIDEQHKFGVGQRESLIKKTKGLSFAPHILSLTATPIPRTIALTLYGDQDFSVLTDMPKGRIPPTTWIVPPEKREGAYDWIKEKIIKEKTQVFIICPLIEESESETLSEVKAVNSEYKILKNIFSQFKIGLLHGKLKNKNTVINDFKKRKYHILVTTPVVEVGIDIPNANIMLIEAADRFGLAALHQLRGRVGRGLTKSYCLLFSENVNKKVQIRLEALRKQTSGYELAEIDLAMRGPGEIFGLKQSGLPELKIARWTDIDIIKKSKEAALSITQNSLK